MTEPPGSHKLARIQELRAIAALSVALFHSLETARGYGLGVQWLAPLQYWGTQGVDLFFVISGFIMVYIQSKRPLASGPFLARRLLRIAPLYWTLTATFAALWLLWPAAFNTRTVEADWIAASLTFTSQAWLGRFPLLYDGWSLEFEVAFYLVFSACLALPRLWQSVAVACALLALWAVVGRQPIVLEFGFGMLLGLACVAGRARIGAGTAVAPWVAGILVYVFAQRYFTGTVAVLALATGGTLLVWGAYHLRPPRPGGWLERVGDASYSIYLVQVFSIPAAYKCFRWTGTTTSPDLLAIACFAIAVVSGYACFYLFERRLARAPSRIDPRLTRAAAHTN